MAITATKTLTMITEYGADATFRTYPSASYSEATGITTTGEATDYSHKVVEENRAEYIAAGAEIVLYVAASGLEFTPETALRVVYAGKTWTSVTLKPIVYKGTTLLYTVELRGAA